MADKRLFSESVLAALHKARILGVRAGAEHRYTGVWVVVVENRVFVRSWNDRPTGWYRAFQTQPVGSIQLAGRDIAIRARQLRGAVVPGHLDAVRIQGWQPVEIALRRGLDEVRELVGAKT